MNIKLMTISLVASLGVSTSLFAQSENKVKVVKAADDAAGLSSKATTQSDSPSTPTSTIGEGSTSKQSQLQGPSEALPARKEAPSSSNPSELSKPE